MSLPHLVTTTSVSGGSQIDKPSPSSSTQPGGGQDKISEWAVPEGTPKKPVSKAQVSDSKACFHPLTRIMQLDQTSCIMLQILAISTTARNAGDSSTAEDNTSEVAGIIRKVIHVQLDTAPLRLLNTVTGLLCDREAQISTFKTSAEYKELLLSTMKHPDLRTGHIAEAVAMYFGCVMLSHRWEDTEPLLHDVHGRVVYKLKASSGLVKLQSFCRIVRDAGYHWAWVDTCCIDQKNNVELQKSLTSMFAWYRNSALTVVYLSDVPPSSKSGALAESAWNTRGWTVPEFLAPKVILFYQQDWSLYLDDHSPNHKGSVKIMNELEDATGIDARALVAFQPGMRDAREKLRWVSTRVTTVAEDIAYSLFDIFGIQLPILYGENKQNALGRLLQEIVAQSGDITALDWVGKPSEFNSCLPADISSYEPPPYAESSLSEDTIQSSVSSLRDAVALESASRLYQTLDYLSAPRFAHRRLQLPCIVFPVTDAMPMPGRDQETRTYEVKADGLHDLQITTKHKFIPFSQARPLRTGLTFLLVRPWSRHILDLPDPADDTQSMEDCSVPESLLHDWPPSEMSRKFIRTLTHEHCDYWFALHSLLLHFC
ncbi:heterokaryon incompatibility protein-domain-containing protein [Suillus paluster]|uniref:heterokaryon incompatibility protein-domain-containing protein n=1 Tax=Suillus paluster TaxID=48578 RepID=UPI001B87DF4F|nr:heterokaryon incompatibility protein-domain-containing protein [Suillus paluster]KAG1741846.1 heterokaryon incompatibility protein-domain-containing protein [Suillus paluster]